MAILFAVAPFSAAQAGAANASNAAARSAVIDARDAVSRLPKLLFRAHRNPRGVVSSL